MRKVLSILIPLVAFSGMNAAFGQVPVSKSVTPAKSQAATKEQQNIAAQQAYQEQYAKNRAAYQQQLQQKEAQQNESRQDYKQKDAGVAQAPAINSNDPAKTKEQQNIAEQQAYKEQYAKNRAAYQQKLQQKEALQQQSKAQYAKNRATYQQQLGQKEAQQNEAKQDYTEKHPQK